MTLAEKFLELMCAELGVEERPRGSNAGPRVNEYLAHVHLAPGNPWCAALVSWAVGEATLRVGGPPQFKPSGSALGLLGRNMALVIPAPEPGCVGIMEHADHIHGHAFAVRGVDGNSGNLTATVSTIEGNSNSDGSRDGYQVCANRRRIDTVKAFIRVA